MYKNLQYRTCKPWAVGDICIVSFYQQTIGVLRIDAAYTFWLRYPLVWRVRLDGIPHAVGEAVHGWQVETGTKVSGPLVHETYLLIMI